MSRWKERRAAGLCGKCGKVESEAVRCPKCRESHLRSMKKYLGRVRKIEGCCIMCGRKRRTTRTKTCPICLETVKKSNKKLRQKKKRNGVCIECGRVPPMPGVLKCEPCKKKHYEATTRWRKRYPELQREYFRLASRGLSIHSVPDTEVHFTEVTR